MADSRIFPQIPTTVWWGLRDQFKKTLPAKVTDAYLAAHMNVQGAAAKTYIGELKRVGLLDAEAKPTDVAKRWRLDDKYREAADEILRLAYPDELIDVAPPAEGDRGKALRWFMEAASLGEGAARNKVGTYFMIGSGSPPSDAGVPSKSDSKGKETRRSAAAPATSPTALPERSPPAAPPKPIEPANFPLNVNIQIHISADASSDQIEAIFVNMKKHLQS